MESKPWLRHYDPGVPHTLAPYPRKTLVDFVADTARERPDHPFLLFKGASLSYAQVDRLSDAFAAALVANGLSRGDRVALLVPNSPQAVICQLGTWKAGGIVLFLNPLYTEAEMRPILHDTQPAAAVVLTPFYDKFRRMREAASVRLLVATNIKEYLPPVLRLAFTLLKEKKGGHRVALQPGDHWLGDLLDRHAGAARPEIALAGGDAALLLCTGGTTGQPKAAVQSHGALVMSGMQITAWFHEAVPAWKSTLMAFMPLFHTYGNSGVLSMAIVSHNTAALVPNPRDLDDVVATVRRVRPATFPAIPTLYNALLEHPKVKSGAVDLRSIRACISGAAPLMAETKRRFEAETGGKLVEGYALTESSMAFLCNPVNGVNKAGSIGIPATDVEARIVNPEDGTQVMPTGEVGELTLRAPNLMTEYWKQPEETSRMLRDGWLFTGDLGYMDADGYVFIVDRKKDLIKPSGFQVWPREVEEVVASHPAVQEVAVAGVADPKQAEAVKAWVVLKAGATADAEAIRAYCRERLAGYKVPKHVEFRNALPKSTVGKVLRRMLRDEER